MYARELNWDFVRSSWDDVYNATTPRQAPIECFKSNTIHNPPRGILKWNLMWMSKVCLLFTQMLPKSQTVRHRKYRIFSAPYRHLFVDNTCEMHCAGVRGKANSAPNVDALTVQDGVSIKGLLCDRSGQSSWMGVRLSSLQLNWGVPSHQKI